MGSLTELARRFLDEKRGSEDATPSDPESTSVELLGQHNDPEALPFDLNCGHNTQAPPIRKAIYQPGEVVAVRSPCFGTFEAEVLKDDGVTVWVFNPFTERETAVPNEWLVGGHDD